jgi:16S rRNA (cytidine1402-2'-O)-methyltransferase
VSAGTLYVVATPLGNLGDLSPRAIEVLGRVSMVAAEDTRRARVLLQRAGASPKVVSFHAHSPPRRIETLLRALREGSDVAMVSDAGTPTVSDPGADLVRRAREAGVPIVSVPGPSAVAAALSISGLPADRYTFLGFVPRKGGARRKLLDTVAESPWTVVLFEAAPRLTELLADLEAGCGGGRDAAVARELTKVHEEVFRGTLGEAVGYYGDRTARGEIVLCIAGAAAAAAAPDSEEAAGRADALARSGATTPEITRALREELGLDRNRAYAVALEAQRRVQHP